MAFYQRDNAPDGIEQKFQSPAFQTTPQQGALGGMGAMMQAPQAMGAGNGGLLGMLGGSVMSGVTGGISNGISDVVGGMFGGK